MRLNRCVISFEDRSLMVQGYRLSLHPKTTSGMCGRVRLEEQETDGVRYGSERGEQITGAFTGTTDVHDNCLVGRAAGRRVEIELSVGCFDWDRFPAEGGAGETNMNKDDNIICDNNVRCAALLQEMEMDESASARPRVPCPDCDATFRKSSEMKRHFQSKHQGLTWHCLDCGRIYRSRDNLRRHTKKRHPTSGPTFATELEEDPDTTDISVEQVETVAETEREQWEPDAEVPVEDFGHVEEPLPEPVANEMEPEFSRFPPTHLQREFVQQMADIAKDLSETKDPLDSVQVVNYFDQIHQKEPSNWVCRISGRGFDGVCPSTDVRAGERGSQRSSSRGTSGYGPCSDTSTTMY